MEFKSLTDKFHYILTSDELYKANPELAANFVASILMEICDKNTTCMVFSSVNNCRKFIELTNKTCKPDSVIDFNELVNNDDNVPNYACILTMRLHEDNNKIAMELEVSQTDDTVEFLQYIIKDRVIDKNINLRKILKTLLFDRSIKTIVKKYKI